MKETLMRKFSFLLAFAILVTTVLTGNGAAIVLAEGNSQGNSVHVKLQESITESLEQGNKHLIHVTAQNSSKDAILKIYLKNEDESPAFDVKATNLYSSEEDITDGSTQKTIAETLQSAVTLQDNTTAALEAAWMTEVDENGNTTARYLEAKLPAGAQTTFDMELLYATEDKSYDRTVKVEAKAFVDESEVTEAADTEDGGKENLVSVQWKNAEEKQSSAQGMSAKANAEEATITTFADSSAYTATQIQAILDFLEAHPQYTLLDTTGMNKNEKANWTTASVLYSYNLEKKDGFIESWKPTELNGTNIVAWDLTGLTSGDMIFSYSNDWNTANTNDYHKTGSKSITELQGNIFQYSGTAQSTSGDDNGKWFYTLEKVVLERSPLSGRDVYLDTTNISGMTTPPILRITNGDGTTTDITMEQCYNQETVFHYQFDSYVLPGTSFQFVNSNGTVTVPDIAVSNIDTTKPCYDGTTWKAYVPEASTVRISVNHDFSDKGGAQVVFTKNGTATGKTIDLGTNGTGSFDFDMADDTYDGFYIKQRDDSQVGNTTEIKTENDIREAVNIYGTPLSAYVGGWINTNTRRTLTFEKYTSLADSSLNIPKATTAFKKDPELYYVNSTFYDYYSDEELKGNNRKNLSGNFDHTAGSSDKVQALTFNRAVSEYFSGTSLMNSGSLNTESATYQSPLYFGELTNAHSINSSLNNFVWLNNNGEPNRVSGASGARQGLVNNTLVNNQLVMGTENMASPYFSEAFLRGSNSTGSEVGKVFNDIQFPFVKNSDGYWEFNSYDSSQSVRMKEDINGKYFLERVGADNAVHGMTMYGGKNAVATNQSNFFPFNDVSESCKNNVNNVNNAKRLNYGFGVRLDIPFYMTSDGKVTMSKSDGTSESKDIVFDFSGDDDVWVFIDGKLILDIGGDHGAVAGQINFATHTATTTTNTTQTVNGTWGSSVTFDALSDTEQHTLTMFYMERGLWESNMHVTFNFPQSNQLVVEKEVVVPDELNTYFSGIKTVLQTETSFPVTIQNKVTSGETVDIKGEKPEVNKVYDAIDPDSSVALNTPKHSSILEVTSGANRDNVLKYYYPGEKKTNEGQEVTDGRSLYITGKENLDISAEQIKNYGYLQFDAYVDDDASASSPFVALVDANGNKIGAWAAGAVYGGGSNTMGSKTWKTLQVSIDKLSFISGSSTFDYANVKKIQIAYWDDVTIYLDNFKIKAPAQYAASTGFTKDQNVIPDYGSYQSKNLEKITGAEYVQTGKNGKQWVDNGRIYLKDKQTAVFSDQFRRESYLSLEEECDSDHFSTTWEISENDEVKYSGTGTVVNDTRTEPSPGNSGAVKPDSDTMLFKSYSEDGGESVTRFFELNVKYTNTLKLGNLQINKSLKAGQEDNRDSYKFEIIFSNVAGMSLEESLDTPLTPITVTMKAGESKTITGIPAGTYYEIREVPMEGQEYTLADAEHTGGNDTFSVNIASSSVTGTVTADETGSSDIYTFTNDINPSVKIPGAKIWSSVSESEAPVSVTLKLQRKLQGQEDTKYEDAKDMDGNAVTPLVITNDSASESEPNKWSFLFTNVPKYNGTGTDKVAYVYRVVETRINGKPVSSSGYLASGGIIDENGNYDVTNTYQDTNIQITKVDASDTDKLLSGVSFKLEKLKSDGSVDTAFTAVEKTTGSTGQCKFENLKDGTYLLTETKTAQGYSLLKEPIKITLNRGGECKVDDKNYPVDSDNNICIKISNRLLFELPTTGGYGRYYMILGGLAIAAAGLFMYRYSKRKKGGMTS